jgi:hypothetical protein
MSIASNGKRLDKIDRQLTPKQWAIRLADEMRQYASEEDFLRAIAKGTYQQSPFIFPFYELGKQAAERWPVPSPENHHSAAILNQKLRGEFHVLKIIIVKANQTIKSKGEMCWMKNALQLSKLQAMTLRDAFEQFARSVATYIGVKELSMDAGIAELNPPSLLRNWADKAAMLLTEIVGYKAAIQIIQERYFGNHPILFKDTERHLKPQSRACAM